MDKFKPGDRVQYTSGGKGIILGKRNGWGGAGWYVQWDKKDKRTSGADWAYENNLTLLPPPTKEEVESALAILRRAGKVDFLPAKAPFTPVRVRLNSDYDAVVSEYEVTVGCQHFTFSAIKALALAVKSAQEYNRGN